VDKTNRTNGQWVLVLLGTGFGAGFAPFAPGTWGSLVGLLLAAAAKSTLGTHYSWLATVVILLSFPVCGFLGRLWNSKDPQRVVLDEIAAIFLIQIFFPVSPVGLVAQFLWFRLFDILKPPPCRQGEQLPGGIGIVADDLIAGLYAILALWLTNCIYPLW